tara:strand:- start:247 stop:1776 length:1530 start_codon:yes stop_codon:yes gene_type:complete
MKKSKISAQPRAQFLETLRNSGYDNYQALADIVDNSLDSEVGSTKVNVNIIYDGKEYQTIQIIDNGCGMDSDTIKEALKLGAITGKSRQNDLGSYGTGLKSAALSIGRSFKVITKSENDELFSVEYDIDSIIQQDNFDLDVLFENEEDIKIFNELVGEETGTVILISKIDKMTNRSVSQVQSLLLKHFGVTFGLFITEKNVEISVNDMLVKTIDPMYRNLRTTRKLSGMDEFITYQDKKIKYNVFYLDKQDKDTLEFSRNHAHAGLWIYRNNRLVGHGVDLGIILKQGDGHLNGLRIEMFIDGSLDSEFGSTYLKLITEKTKGHINQSLVDTCKKTLGSYTTQVRNMEKDKKKSENNNSEQKNILDDVFKNINDNKFIDIPKKGKNDKNETKTEKKEVKNPGRNKFSERKRNDYYADYRLVSLGQYGNIYRPGGRDKGVHIIEINTDHIYWEEFLSQQSEQTIGAVVKEWMSQVLALSSVEYYNDTDKESLLNEFFAKASENLRKMIQY